MTRVQRGQVLESGGLIWIRRYNLDEFYKIVNTRPDCQDGGDPEVKHSKIVHTYVQ